ncbi:MAG: polyphenol oxidase family protein [Candidatus Hydrogenedentes bacterium]|nr:polyphenol oxidase family protein [Candidatus Hydrogenedentota bacterium]
MIRFEFLERFGVVAAMSDRMDGDCSFRGPADVLAKFLERIGGAVAHLVCARQVHGNQILTVDRRHAGQGALNLSRAVGEADGLITGESRLPIGVTIADCVPVFLYAPGSKAGGIVHAGREGTRAGISGAAVAALGEARAASQSEIVAVIGPSAGPCCYEVSAEMADEWAEAGLPRGGRRLDLWEANRQQLLEAGVPADNIHVAGQCTICNAQFHSHRRSPGEGHNLAVLIL